MESNPDLKRARLYREHRQRVLAAKSVLATIAPRLSKEPQELRVPLTFVDYLAQIVSTVRPNMFTFTKSPESISMTQLVTDNIESEDSKRPTRNTTANNEYKKPANHDIFENKQKNTKLIRQRDIFMQDGQLHVRSLSSIENHIMPRVLQRYREATQIMNDELLRKLMRPKIYLEFCAGKSQRNMGHLEIQLFTEACPAVVLEFVRMCFNGARERLKITHLVEQISLECELSLNGDDSSLAEPNFEYDTSAIDHGSGPGILSCPLRYAYGTRNKRLRFSISLRPLGTLNGKRVAFGKAFGDLRLLQKVQRYAKAKKGINLQIKVKTCGIGN